MTREQMGRALRRHDELVALGVRNTADYDLYTPEGKGVAFSRRPEGVDGCLL